MAKGLFDGKPKPTLGPLEEGQMLREKYVTKKRLIQGHVLTEAKQATGKRSGYKNEGRGGDRGQGLPEIDVNQRETDSREKRRVKMRGGGIRLKGLNAFSIMGEKISARKHPVQSIKQRQIGHGQED